MSMIFPSLTYIYLSVSLCTTVFPSPASYASLLKATWVFQFNSPLSPYLSLPSSLPYCTYLSLTFSRCQHKPCLSSFCTYLPPLFLSNCLHLRTLLVNYLTPYAAIKNCLHCLDDLYCEEKLFLHYLQVLLYNMHY